MSEETQNERFPVEPGPTTVMATETVEALATQLLGRLLAAAEEARLNYGTVATLLGVSRSRISQFSDAVKKGEGVNVSAHTFLSTVRLTKRIAAHMADGRLPAAGTKGKAQEVVLQQLQAG